MTENDPFSALSDTAMVLAAGFGVRMRPLTLARPKPLLEVGGRTMLDRALDHVCASGLRRAVVNAHYLGAQIEKHLASRAGLETVLSYEEEILDTGGGVKNALPYFAGKPFFVMSADLPWLDGPRPALARLAQAWNPARMDVLLMVMEREKAKGFSGAGDFAMRADSSLWRKGAAEKKFVFLSVMIVNPDLYDERPEKAFSNNLIFDHAEEKGRLFGLVHDGACFHVGTPEDLKTANILLQTGVGWR